MCSKSVRFEVAELQQIIKERDEEIENYEEILKQPTDVQEMETFDDFGLVLNGLSEKKWTKMLVCLWFQVAMATLNRSIRGTDYRSIGGVLASVLVSSLSNQLSFWTASPPKDVMPWKVFYYFQSNALKRREAFAKRSNQFDQRCGCSTLEWKRSIRKDQ